MGFTSQFGGDLCLLLGPRVASPYDEPFPAEILKNPFGPVRRSVIDHQEVIDPDGLMVADVHQENVRFIPKDHNTEDVHVCQPACDGIVVYFR